MLGFRVAQAATALQLFSDPKQAISVVAIAEDAEGSLWIAADQGVFQFDGNDFLKIPGPFEGPAAIAVIGKRTVVIGCNNGVFQYRNGVIKKLTTDVTNALIALSEDTVLAMQSRVDSSFRSIHWTSAVIWEGTQVQLRSLNEITGWVWPSANGWLSFACGSHPCSLQNSDAFRQALRAGGLKGYFHQNAREAGNIELLSPIESLAMDSSGTYFFRSPFSGLVSVRLPGGKGRDYNIGEFTRANGRAGLNPARSGRIWIPGDDLYVSEGATVRRFVTPQLDAIRVNCVFEDARGHTWFGLAEKGLAVMGMGPVAESWNTLPSLGGINSIVRSSPSAVYATTSKGTILMRHGKEDWRPLNPGQDGPKVVYLAPGDGGTLIGLTSIGPPVRLAANGRVLEQISPAPSMMLSSLRPLMRAPDGTYFIGSKQLPPCLYHMNGTRVETIAVEGPNGNVHDIVADSRGRVWVGYGDGVCRIENQVCRPAISQADGLLDSTIQSLAVDPPDEIWVAYRSGKAFSRFRLLDGRWVPRHFLPTDGYPMPLTQFFRRDRRGWIWRGTNQGLFVSDGVHVEAGDWLLISERDGLPSASVSQFGFLEDPDGSVWIGTARGIAHLYPEPAWFQPNAPKITSITFQDKKFLKIAALPGVLEGGGQFSATVGGSGLLPVRYRLLPADRTWQISYTGETQPRRLEPGHYELEIAPGPGGPPARYRFQIVPTLAAKLRLIVAIGLLSVVLFAFGVFRWRRGIREARLPQLPDLTEARLAILSPDIHSLIGTTLSGRFVPQKLLAQGGFGTVFDGRDLASGARCAIKVFGREFGDERLTPRFQQEIAALRATQHPNVVKLLGHGDTPAGSTFLVMEFIEGSTLREALNKGPIPAGTCARFLRQIGGALHAIHSRDIFHRDLKPENLMIRGSAPASAEIVLIDFSMAILKDPDRSLFGLSRAGGTVHYMAPEQALGHASAEGDIYSLAKVVIEMLTGRRMADLLPEATLDLSEQVRAFLQAQPFGLSPRSMELLASSLEFDPMRRIKSVSEFIEPIARDLESFAASARQDLPAAIVLPSPSGDGPVEG